MKKILPLLVVLLLAWVVFSDNGSDSTAPVEDGQQVLAEAFANRRSDVQVMGSGVVTRLLADDNEGSRHQRFVLEIDGGQSILIAHNIDLAPRIGDLAKGDRVDFHGEYEWNERGGVVHWTHRDPAGRHVGGWLKHEGRTYE